MDISFRKWMRIRRGSFKPNPSAKDQLLIKGDFKLKVGISEHWCTVKSTRKGVASLSNGNANELNHKCSSSKSKALYKNVIVRTSYNQKRFAQPITPDMYRKTRKVPQDSTVVITSYSRQAFSNISNTKGPSQEFKGREEMPETSTENHVSVDSNSPSPKFLPRYQ